MDQKFKSLNKCLAKVYMYTVFYGYDYIIIIILVALDAVHAFIWELVQFAFESRASQVHMKPIVK